jgi:hypothetical protein
MDPKVSEEKM